jgi:predicted GH43/DUF377 family glycosyl hydrolase
MISFMESGTTNLNQRFQQINHVILLQLHTVDDWPYRANSVFNPAAAIVDGKVLLLVRVEDQRGFSHFTVARSENGVDN